jgi:hypothetical protein
MAFFWRWWFEQTEDMQNQVRELVNQGYFMKPTTILRSISFRKSI